jgi:prevent-host-death family protein
MYINMGIEVGIEERQMEKVKTIGIAEVRLKLTQLVDDVSRGGQPYTIVSSSRAKAVLMGVDEYNALIEKLEDLEDIAEMNQAVRDPESRISWAQHLKTLKEPDKTALKASA